MLKFGFKETAFCTFIILSFLHAQIAVGQSPGMEMKPDLLTNLIPPSPNAASLGKFGEVPVTLYTGQPNISIPFGNIEGRQLQMPVTLSYMFNGLRPMEEAGWVGLGWSLNVGGAISRTIRGRVDEQNHTVSNVFSYEYFLANILKQSDQNGFDANQSYLQMQARGYCDTEPDLYSFNFGNYSGQFIIVDGKPITLPYQKLMITGNAYSENGFTIVSEDGTTYNFDRKEITRPKEDGSGYTLPRQFVSSWLLGSIYSADQKDYIKFNYASPETIHQPGVKSQTLKRTQLVSGNYADELTPVSTSFKTRVDQLRLIEIETPKMSVDFNISNSARADIDGMAFALDHIQINYIGGFEKQFKFYTSYFGHSKGSNFSYPSNYHLRLDKVEELSNTEVKKHIFEYDQTSPWPNKGTTALDHWGFYNGASESNYLIPNEISSLGGNREPNPVKSKLGLLEKVIYPSGGCSVFEFEGNVFYNGKNKKTIERAATLEVNHIGDLSPYNQFLNFNITHNQNSKITFSFNPANIPADGFYTHPGFNSNPEVRLRRYDENHLLISSPVFEGKIKAASDIGKIWEVPLTAGQYQLEVICDPYDVKVSGSVIHQEQTNEFVEGEKGPGLRIRSISSYLNSEATGAPDLKKNYLYTDLLGVSTGSLLKPAVYSRREFIRIIGIDQTTSLTYSSSLGSSLGSIVGQSLYYNSVYEELVDPKQLSGPLKSLSVFKKHDALVYSGTLSSGIYLWKKINYRFKNNKLEPVNKVENFYADWREGHPFYAIKPYLWRYWTDDLYFVPADKVYTYKYEDYWTHPTWRFLEREMEVSYSENGDSLMVETNYEYDTAGSHNLLAIHKKKSTGYTNTTRFKYPESYSSSLVQFFINKHFLSPVLEQQTWQKYDSGNSILLEGKITEFHPTLLKPTKIHVLEISSPVNALNLETKLNGKYSSLISDTRYVPRLFNEYDPDNGQLISQDLMNREDLKQVGYIWGYNKNFPIGQFKNATRSKVFYTGFEFNIIPEGGWDYNIHSISNAFSHTGVSCFTGSLITGSNIPNGDYKLSLWTKGAGAIVVNGLRPLKSSSLNDWKLLEWVFNNPGSLIIENPNGNYLDDIRLNPSDAELTTFTFKPGAGLSSTSDVNNVTTFFEYDGFGRLKLIKNDKGDVLKSFEYNYRKN